MLPKPSGLSLRYCARKTACFQPMRMRLPQISCRRLSAAMPMPTNPPLAGYRVIPKHLPHDSAFNQAVAKKLEATDQLWTANTLWELVYDEGHDLPPDVVDPR